MEAVELRGEALWFAVDTLDHPCPLVGDDETERRVDEIVRGSLQDGQRGSLEVTFRVHLGLEDHVEAIAPYTGQHGSSPRGGDGGPENGAGRAGACIPRGGPGGRSSRSRGPPVIGAAGWRLI